MRFHKLNQLIQFVAALLTIGLFLWPILKNGLQATVPAWLSLLAILIAFMLGHFLKPRTAKLTISPKRIHEVRFDYLPASPANRDWTLVIENDTRSAPEFLAASDSPIPGSLLIRDRGAYYLDYEVEPFSRIADTVELYAKFMKNSALYLKVKVGSRDQSAVQVVWLAYVPGSALPRRFSKEEWTIFVTGEDVLVNGWMRLRLPIAAEVEKTYGSEGWIFQELVGIRLRGSLSISPIAFYG